MPTNDHDLNQPERTIHTCATPSSRATRRTDVNVSGIVVFLAGLFGSVCRLLRASALSWARSSTMAISRKEDGPSHEVEPVACAGQRRAGKRRGPGQQSGDGAEGAGADDVDLPEPRLDIDDGNQATADLHAREDLLLDHYSHPCEMAVRFGFRSRARWS